MCISYLYIIVLTTPYTNHKSTSQARAARQVASIESKAATKLEKCRKRHSIELADKDKEIKVQYI